MHSRRFYWLALLAWATFFGIARSQETPHPQPTPAKPMAEAEPVDREVSIYVPYGKLKEVFEKEGRGVFLPYDKFLALWKAAREAQQRVPDSKPPFGAIATEIESEAVVGKDVVRVSAKVKFEVLAEGWSQVPLGLTDAAVLSAKLGDEPARLIHDPQAGYKLLVEKRGKEPKKMELKLEYAKAFTKAPGQNSVTFQAPQAPVNHWKIRIPETDVKVNIHPLIAATEVPANAVAAKPQAAPMPDEDEEQQDPPQEKNGKQVETVVMAFVGASPTVRFDWTPKAEGATGLTALATVQAQQEAIVAEGVLRSRARLVYEITRAEVSQLEIEVPADQKVVNVFDPNVRQWEVKAGEMGVQTIQVQLFQPTRGTQNLTVELEKFSGEQAQQEITVPMIKALNVGRQQGVLVVQLSQGLRAEPTGRTGLMQLDAGELPNNLARGNWAFAYRYAAVPYELKLSVEKVQPRILAEELVEAYLEPEQLTLNLFAVYTIERAGVFQLELDVPAGFEVRQVRGHACAGAEAVAVDAWHAEGDDKTRLIVNLGRKAMGKVGLFVELARRLNDTNLLSPTGQSSEVTVALARVAATGVERRSGKLVVYAPESLRTNPTKQDGLRNISFEEAFINTESTRAGRFPNLRTVLAMAFTDQQAELTLSVERRKPHITAAQLLAVQVDSGVVKYEATFFYDIRYSGVKSLRIDVPKELAAEIRNLTTGVREKTIDPQPEGVAEGYVAWSFAGESEFNGQTAIKLAWERKLEKLEIGKPVDLDIPRLKPADVDRAWGQVVLSKAETIDVLPSGEPKGLRPIDPRHDLMPGAVAADAARAFEFHDDWTLAIQATRYKLEEVKRTSIERAWVRVVATRSDQLAVQGLYRLRSAEQRLALQLPPEVQFDTQPLKLNGRSVQLEKGDQDEYYIPLVGQSPDDPLVLELRYTLKGSASQIDLPHFPGDPAVQKVYLSVYLPQELTLLGSQGPWADELNWVDNGTFDRVPRPRMNDNELVNWVTGGVSLTGAPPTSFETDGQMYLFSTLRPEKPPTGSLKLSTLDEDWLNAFVFLAIVAAGLALIRLPLTSKLGMLAFFVALVVLAGVFWPIFSKQILDGVFASAVFLVFIAWLAYHVMIAPPQWKLTVVRTPEEKPAEPAPASQESPFAAAEVVLSGESPPNEPPAAPRQQGGHSNG